MTRAFYLKEKRVLSKGDTFNDKPASAATRDQEKERMIGGEEAIGPLVK